MIFVADEVSRPKGPLRLLTRRTRLDQYSSELVDFIRFTRGDYLSRLASGDARSFVEAAGPSLSTQAFRGWRWIWEAERLDEFSDHPLNNLPAGMEAVVAGGQIFYLPQDAKVE